MALFKRRCFFTDINCGKNINYHFGPIGGSLTASIIIIALSALTGLAVHSCYYDDSIERQDCLAALEKNRNASCTTKNPYLSSLRLILRGSNQEAANELNRVFQPLAKDDKLINQWTLQKIYTEVKLGMERRKALYLLCSTFASNNRETIDYMICDNADKAAEFYQSGYIKPARVHLGFYTTALVAYLLCGIVFMISFITHFGRPSGGVIAWMTVFAPIFIPFWAIVGLGSISYCGLRSAKRGLTARLKVRAAKKQKKNEARLVGKEVIDDKEEIARLTEEIEADGTVPADIKQSLKGRLQEIREKNEREAEMRVKLKDLARVRGRAEKLSAKVDEVEIRVAARENVRKSFSDNES